MFNPPSFEPIDVIGNELLNLLTVYFAYNQKLQPDRPLWRQMSRAELMSEIISVQTLEHEMVLRLCRLDDDAPKQYSFRHLKKVAGHKQSSQIDQAIKSYRNKINPLKVQYRNKRIAHLSTDWPLPVQKNQLIKECIRAALEVFDLFCDDKHKYNLQLASDIPKVDLRALLDSN